MKPKKNWEIKLDEFFREFNPVESPGSLHKYLFANTTKLGVRGRQVTDAEIRTCPKIKLTVNELLDLKFQYHNLIVKKMDEGVEDPKDHPILRKFFNIQDLQEEEEFGRPNGKDHEDNINVAVIKEVPLPLISTGESINLDSKKLARPCARFECRRRENFIGMCEVPGCSDRITFPKEEYLSDPKDTSWMGFVTPTHHENVEEPDREIIELAEEDEK